MHKEIIGEFIGTFVLVFIGLGTVAWAVLFGNLQLYEIAVLWWIGVTLGIYSSKKISNSHLNPAVSFGFLLQKKISLKQFIAYNFAQYTGALLAAISIYLIFEHQIETFETANGIIRGNESSKQTAMIFGEFYPNPTNTNLESLSTFTAFILEAFGTFFIMLMILVLTSLGKKIEKFLPILIGASVGLVIYFIAPYTQAGFNPARDLSPRLFSAFEGWGKVAFDLPSYGFITVYVIAPFVGAYLASSLFSRIIQFKH